MTFELRWANPKTGEIGLSPTATDALEYADKKLSDPEEFDCCKNDDRSFQNVHKFIKEAGL